METKNTTELSDKLEQLIDTHGLYRVLNEIERVCGKKSEHVASNWQDYGLSRQWEAAAIKIELLADGIEL